MIFVTRITGGDAWSAGLLPAMLMAMLFVDPAAASVQEAKTLTRFHDPVIVKTFVLTGLPTRETAEYRLYSSRHGELSPYPVPVR